MGGLNGVLLGEFCHLGATRRALGPQHRLAFRRDFFRSRMIERSPHSIQVEDKDDGMFVKSRCDSSVDKYPQLNFSHYLDTIVDSEYESFLALS